ncbi:DivIVA domain-containing protein [Varibaculum cambriense]|uniref:DivIVA domain-containing protein n=1 Tax=uncultured Varibaculum sp. TaxID=413896 RepID=UPI002151380B|nr:DivIVA domain-containing protein [uncultured Varibaculum sp.]WIK89068.1 DivIVA domain-containing protein [Varibaculum cambriense]
MALLTAEDVHWKQFQATKFREGYDQEEVDEFLDEVVETIATLQDQNASLKSELDEVRQQAAAGGVVAPSDSGEETAALKAQLETANAQIAEMQAQVQQYQAAAAEGDPQAGEQIQALQAHLAQTQQEAQAALAQSQAETQQAVAEIEQLREQLAQAEQNSQAAAQSSAEQPEDATSMLALAQRVHDEYVRNGQQEADQILEDSRLKGDQIVREANDERRRVLEQLESERADLESRVDDLKAFENDYRQKVREHLQVLIGQLDAQEA